MAKTARSGSKKKTILSILAVVAVLAVAAGIGVLAQFLTQQQNVVQDEGPRLPKVVDDIQNMRSEGASQEEIDKKLADALADESLDSETRYLVYIQQGHKLVSEEKWQEAIGAYTLADQIKETSETAELIAEAYVSAGNKDKAIEYFKKAITRIPQDFTLADAMKEAYEEKIRSLGGQP